MTPDRTKTQFQRSKIIREKYNRWAPILAELKDDLAQLLDEASNATSEGTSDGTIGSMQHTELRCIKDCTGNLLTALLFDTRGKK